MNGIEVKTLVVEIRPLVEEDALTSVNWRNDPSIWEYTEFRPNKHILLEDELEWIKKAIEDKHSHRFAIVADQTYVGNIYLTDIENNSAEYHIFIGNHNFAGRGVAYEASKKLIGFAKNSLGLTKIYLNVRTEHKRAIALYEKLGFTNLETKNDFFQMYLDL